MGFHVAALHRIFVDVENWVDWSVGVSVAHLLCGNGRWVKVRHDVPKQYSLTHCSNQLSSSYILALDFLVETSRTFLHGNRYTFSAKQEYWKLRIYHGKVELAVGDCQRVRKKTVSS